MGLQWELGMDGVSVCVLCVCVCLVCVCVCFMCVCVFSVCVCVFFVCVCVNLYALFSVVRQEVLEKWIIYSI